MSSFKVTKCICCNITFEEILAYAKEHEKEDIDELRAADICSTNCRMCDPYIRITLTEGVTEFEPGAYLKQMTG